MKLALAPVERAGLVAFAKRLGLRPKDILLRFVRDLTECPKNGGSNECAAANYWAQLSLWPIGQKLTPAQESRSWALDSAFHRLRAAEEAATSRAPVGDNAPLDGGQHFVAGKTASAVPATTPTATPANNNGSHQGKANEHEQ